MRRFALSVLLAAAPSLAGGIVTLGPLELSPEAQLVAASLRPDERARVEKALGPFGALPLYRFELDFDPVLRKASGRLSLSLTPKKALSEVLLRLTPNANHEGAVTLSNARVNGRAARLEVVEPSLMRVRLPESAKAGDPLLLEVSLSASVPATPEGSDQLAASDPTQAMEDRGGDYGAFSVAPEISCLAGVVPMVPPERNGKPMQASVGIGDLGTFEPSNFIVSVTVPRGYVVVAPGNQVGELPDAHGSTRYAFALAAARELPILVTKGFEVQTRTVGDVVVESHVLARDKEVGEAVLDSAVRALKSLEEKLGPYPYKRFRVVEARLANGAGGMEFPGLITVSTSLYRGTANPLSVLGLGEAVDNPLIAGLLQATLQPLLASTLEFTVDHEVAHQYFAMLVGNDPIAEPIVDESLTQHAALLLLERHHGKKVADELRDAQLRTSFQLHRLMGGADGKANRSASAFTSNIEYAALIYGKAPLLFDELRALVGDAAWDKALRTYVDENRYRWATPTTLTSLLARQNPAQASKIEALRRHWWEEAHGDADLGALDLGQLLQGQSGNTMFKGAIDPQVLKEYQRAMHMLSGEE